MKDGEIAEEGTHNCLMGLSGGEYSNLINTFYDSKEHTDDNEKPSECCIIANIIYYMKDMQFA